MARDERHHLENELDDLTDRMEQLASEDYESLRRKLCSVASELDTLNAGFQELNQEVSDVYSELDQTDLTDPQRERIESGVMRIFNVLDGYVDVVREVTEEVKESCGRLESGT